MSRVIEQINDIANHIDTLIRLRRKIESDWNESDGDALTLCTLIDDLICTKNQTIINITS